MRDSREDSRYLGAGHRLSSGPAEQLARSAFSFELETAPVFWHHLGSADAAHLATLVRGGVVAADDALVVMDGLVELDARPHDPGDLDAFAGDVHNNRDVQLQELVGPVAGILNTGRARREATTIAWQIACRDRLAMLASSLDGLTTALVDLAHEHRGTYMPDQTYLQRAHPTTLGHYLLGFAFPATRALESIVLARTLVNRSPAGSGSVNGTVLPIDRTLLAELLEFDGIVSHTRDAMWAPDMALDQAHCIVLTAVVVDRLAEELQFWTTEDVRFATLSDDVTRTSVIMPQKKNPYGLAYARGVCRRAIGRYAGLAATMMTVSGQPDNRMFAYVEVPVLLDSMVGVLDLMTHTVSNAEFDTDRMRRSAESGFSYATDICDYLVQRHRLDNRTAHNIVGTAVRAALDQGAENLTSEDLGRAAAAVGVRLDVPADELATVQSLSHVVSNRRGVGGAASDRVDEMIDEIRSRLTDAAGRQPRGNPAEFGARVRKAAKQLIEGSLRT